MSDVFDALLEPDRKDAYQLHPYADPETIDGHAPLCGDLIAWRHPAHGNYTDTELADSFVRAHDNHYSRELFTAFECLAWLLSDESNWMPSQLCEKLLNGMRNSIFLWSRDVLDYSTHFSEHLWKRSKSRFKITKNIKSDIEEMFRVALDKLDIEVDPATVTNRFIEGEFIDGYYEEQRRIREARIKH